MTSRTISGITVVAGERVIPATKRPDGTLRPERRIRIGYTPKEDRATYANGTLAIQPLEKGQVVGADDLVTKDSNGRITAIANTSGRESAQTSTSYGAGINLNGFEDAEIKGRNAKRNEKKREKKKLLEEANSHSDHHPTHEDNTQQSQSIQSQTHCTSEEKEKKLRNLRKKLKQIEILQEKIKSGQQLDAEQIEKANKQEALIKEIEELSLTDTTH